MWPATQNPPQQCKLAAAPKKRRAYLLNFIPQKYANHRGTHLVECHVSEPLGVVESSRREGRRVSVAMRVGGDGLGHRKPAWNQKKARQFILASLFWFSRVAVRREWRRRGSNPRPAIFPQWPPRLQSMI